MIREPYLVTVIRQLADLEAKDSLTADEEYRLTGCRGWLTAYYPEVAAALALEYGDLATRNAEEAARDRSHVVRTA